MAASSDTRVRPAVCLVTNELYPLSPGGIGRLMYNFARQNDVLGRPVDLHFLVPPEMYEGDGARARIEGAFAGIATVHACPPLERRPRTMAQLLGASIRHHGTIEQTIALGVSYMEGLLAAEAEIGRPFDVVEFPDFGGWALATVEAKRAGLAFGNTLIAARLHSSLGVILDAERFAHHPSAHLGLIADAERHLLAHADLVVGHVRAVIDHNARFYGLAERWADRTVLEFPPILFDERVDGVPAPDRFIEQETGRSVDERQAEPDFVFSSRLQPFKRPDLFVRAAVAFLERRPGYGGTFRVVSYGWDEDYIADLRALVPPALAERIVFRFDTPPAVRAALVRSSIVVVPSDYESLCLFAYEASQMGAKVILNARCLAFGEGERWRAGENCLMFDGTAADLVERMAEAIDWRPGPPVDATPDPPYWTRPPAPREAPEACPAPRPPTLVLFGARQPADLDDQVLALSRHALDEVSVHCILARSVLERAPAMAETLAARGWTVSVLPGFGDDVEAFAAVLADIDCDLLALLPVGHELHPGYLATAHEAFVRDPSLDLFAGHLRMIDESTGRADGVRAYAGKMPSLALVSSRVAPRVAVFRRDLPRRVPFDPRAGSNWFEAWTRDLALCDAELLVAPVLAADVPGGLDRRENSKHLAAGVLDGFGRRAGLAPRLIALDPLQAPGRDEEPVVVRKGAALAAARYVGPPIPRDYPLVSARPDIGGVLVHPTAERPTVAVLAGACDERVRRIVVVARNASPGNMGVECAVGLAPVWAPESEILQLADEDPPEGSRAVSAWHLVPPNRDVQISLPTAEASFGGDQIVLMTRLPVGGEEIYSHLVFVRVEEHPNRSLL